MKFAHLADCHIGGWREEKLKQLNLEAFRKAINGCVEENVAFIIIAGDLFNTSLPSIDLLKETAQILEKLRNNDINVYVIPGSHDFSPSGKTMLDVLENAGLIVNVCKFKEIDGKIKLDFTIDKTGVKLTGLYGKKGGLDKTLYALLERTSLEQETGFKIFLFHTALHEYKPEWLEQMEAPSMSILPKNFNYYAGGHPHYVFNNTKADYGLIAFPGALFPNNFKELEHFKHGGFYVCDDKQDIRYVPVKIKDVASYYFLADNKTPEGVEDEILNAVKNEDDKIVTIRVEGILKNGKPSDINFNKILAKLNNAYFVLKNTYKLSSKEFEQLDIESGNVDDVESSLINKQLEKLQANNKDFIIELMNLLNKEKLEGETNKDFETRLIKDLIKIQEIEEVYDN